MVCHSKKKHRLSLRKSGPETEKEENGKNYIKRSFIIYTLHQILVSTSRMRWASHVVRMGETRNEFTIFVGKPEGKRPLYRLKRRWEDNIKMNLQETGYVDMKWIHLGRDKNQLHCLVKGIINIRVI
jgi:hypothetical protein